MCIVLNYFASTNIWQDNIDESVICKHIKLAKEW